MQKTNIKLFKRESNNDDFLKYVDKIESKLNQKNFSKFFNKNLNLYNSSEFIHYQRYVFLLLSKWIAKNEAYTSSYIDHLNFLIKKYELTNKLYGIEKKYIHIIEEIIFNSKRNLKNIVVNFPKISYDDKEEEIFFHIVNVNFLSPKLLVNGDVFITNTRLVFAQEFSIFGIPFKDISKYKLTNKGLEIEAYKVKYEIEPLVDDPRVLYVSFERIFNGNNQR